MKKTTIPSITLVTLVFLTFACEDDAGYQYDPSQNQGTDDTDSSNDTANNGTDSAAVCDLGDLSGVCAGGSVSSLYLTDDYNYQFSSVLNISSTVVKGGSPIVDLTFDWSGVTQDFLGHAVNPLIDINMVLITLWNLSQAEIIDMFNRDAMDQTKLMGALMAYPNDTLTSENLLDFTLYGTPITSADDVALRDSFFNAADPGYDPNLYTHLVMAQSDVATPGKDVRMLKFFTLDTNSTETAINLTSDATTIQYTVDMKSQQRIPVAVGNPSVYINWEYVTKTATDATFFATKVSRVVVAHYDETVCELENNFLDLEIIPENWYYSDLSTVATSYNLSALTTADGVPFSGITTEGTWIIGLFCTLECANPAPLFMTILHPC